MTDWLPNAVVYQIHTWAWLQEWSQAARRQLALQELPDEAWDRLADLGIDAVWLMGVWERSPAATNLARQNRSLLSGLRQQIPDFRTDDIVGSPYSIRRYEVDARFGGAAGLAAVRKALAKRGIRLLLDFVPNHIAPDHPWVTAHPDWLIRGSSADLGRRPGSFLKTEGGIFARGKDPYFAPWSDVLQLNVFNRDQRRQAISELRRIADQCDGVRCDMAMLVMNQVFARTWSHLAQSAPAEDYWQEVIPAVKASHPGFQLIAEVYWDLELSLFEQGFDACYDKGFYDCLAHGSPESLREHLRRYTNVQERLLRFLENHDEPRAAQTFPPPKSLAAAVVVLTLPGVRLLYEGQLEGRTIRTPVQLGRRPADRNNILLEEHYSKLLRLVANRVFHTGQWSWCDSSGWPDNQSYRHLLSWCWREGPEQWLIIVNYSGGATQGRVRVPWSDLAGKSWRLVDPLAGEAHERNGGELTDPGLFVALQPWGYHLLRFEPKP